MNFECFSIPRTLKVKLTMTDVWFFCIADEGRSWMSNMYRHFPINGEFEGWLRLTEASAYTPAVYTGTIDVAGARVGVQVFRAPSTDKIYSTGNNANIRFTARSFFSANTGVRETFTEYGDAILTIQPSTLSTVPRARHFFIPPSDITIDSQFTLKAGEEFEVVDLGYPSCGYRPQSGVFPSFVDAPYILRKFNTDTQEYEDRTVWFVNASNSTEQLRWFQGMTCVKQHFKGGTVAYASGSFVTIPEFTRDDFGYEVFQIDNSNRMAYGITQVNQTYANAARRDWGANTIRSVTASYGPQEFIEKTYTIHVSEQQIQDLQVATNRPMLTLSAYEIDLTLRTMTYDEAVIVIDAADYFPSGVENFWFIARGWTGALLSYLCLTRNASWWASYGSDVEILPDNSVKQTYNDGWSFIVRHDDKRDWFSPVSYTTYPTVRYLCPTGGRFEVAGDILEFTPQQPYYDSHENINYSPPAGLLQLKPGTASLSLLASYT